ncbi:hypothetical protein [Caballeronia glathei]|uniref:hypothetical protein n=1 Tax=Caballeronia glathei TaxID=60547 RepID=UPI00137850A5|nr:hypothetical protein [Caballeronia glathei]
MKKDDDKDVWDNVFSGIQIMILWMVIGLPAYKEYGGMGPWLMLPVALGIWWVGRKLLR